MSRTVFTMIAVTLTLFGLAFAARQTQRVPQTTRVEIADAQRVQLEKAIPAQQRVNRYFHSDVMPKLKDCWSSLQGKGSIDFEHNYKKGSDGRFVSAGIVVSKSTLARGQDAVALRCMQAATRGTSFAADSTDGTSYVLKWNWPVPFPPNAGQLTNDMFAMRLSNTGGGGSGGCDGAGTQAKCYTCSKDGRDCDTVCVGVKECKISFPGRNCTAGEGKCASGGPFGVAGGGRVIY